MIDFYTLAIDRKFYRAMMQLSDELDDQASERYMVAGECILDLTLSLLEHWVLNDRSSIDLIEAYIDDLDDVLVADSMRQKFYSLVLLNEREYPETRNSIDYLKSETLPPGNYPFEQAVFERNGNFLLVSTIYVADPTKDR